MSIEDKNNIVENYIGQITQILKNYDITDIEHLESYRALTARFYNFIINNNQDNVAIRWSSTMRSLANEYMDKIKQEFGEETRLSPEDQENITNILTSLDNVLSSREEYDIARTNRPGL